MEIQWSISQPLKQLLWDNVERPGYGKSGQIHTKAYVLIPLKALKAEGMDDEEVCRANRLQNCSLCLGLLLNEPTAVALVHTRTAVCDDACRLPRCGRHFTISLL